MKLPLKNEVRKPSKTLAGVSPIAVMIYPKKCKHGVCLYCPSLNVPQSYTPKSPPVLRATLLNYDAYKQVQSRLKAYKVMNHPRDKIELIIMGGTFLDYTLKYQYKIIKQCYDALNDKISKTLEQAKKLNEKTKHRCVALCVETRPDVCTDEHIKRLLEFGCTRVELGVQAIDDKIYKKVNRGHTVKDVIDATKRLKDAGFKVFYHLMLGLPGSTPKKDIKMFEKIFSDEKFKPDGLKIYPCQVIKGSKLEKTYSRGQYSPYDEKTLLNLLINLKLKVPRYCRIMRIMREIPPEYLVAGTTRIDLRNELQKIISKRRLKCNCIRCREVGFSLYKGKKIDLESIKLCRLDYNASRGKEIFLSFEDTKNNILIALLRLRIIKNKKISIIREMHTYGKSIKIGGKEETTWQHKGYGKLLLKEAEKIANEEFNIEKMIIISGVGVREYFYHQGYKLDGSYVSKKLK